MESDIAKFKSHWASPEIRHERGFLYDLCALAGASWRWDFAPFPNPPAPVPAEVSRRLGLYVYVDSGAALSELIVRATLLANSLSPFPPRVLVSDLAELWFWDTETEETEQLPLADLTPGHLARWFEPPPTPVAFTRAPFLTGAEYAADERPRRPRTFACIPNRLGRPIPPATVSDLQQANQVASQIRGRRDPNCPSARAAIRSAEILVELLTEGYSTAEISEASGMKPSQITARLKLVTKLSVHQLRKQAFANK